MKLVSKIAILVLLIVFVSSCQKEKLPVPGSPSQLENSANLRVSNSSDSITSGPDAVKGEEETGADQIVGGGDDDRDGGGKKGKN